MPPLNKLFEERLIMPRGLDTKKTVRIAEYDFDLHGGEIGAIELPGMTIPSDAVVTGAFIDVLTDISGGAGATISLGLETAVDVKAVTLVTSVSGISACAINWSASNMVKTTASRPVTLTIAEAALTAGRFNVVLEYVISD